MNVQQIHTGTYILCAEFRFAFEHIVEENAGVAVENALFALGCFADRRTPHAIYSRTGNFRRWNIAR
jgi:hypothetical protein